MHFLEDFMDNIEDLPQKINTGLTELRDMDLQVEHSMDHVQKKMNALFSIANSISENKLETTFNTIMKEGNKSIQKSQKKVQLADCMHKNLTKYLAQLDTNLHQFKMELEADNSGVTERIEKKCLDLEQLNMANCNENKNSLNRRLFRDKHDASKTVGTSKQNSTSIASNSVGGKDVALSSQYRTSPAYSQKVPSSLASTLGHMRAGGSPAIAAAASQAVVTTKKKRGRPANSQKAQSSLASTLGHMGAGGSPAIAAAVFQAVVTTKKKRGRRRVNSQKGQSSLASTLGHIEAGGSPVIVAAASQAIVATKQLSQEHRIAGLKTSLKVINFETPSTSQMSSASACVFPSELPIVKELADVAHSVNPNMDRPKKYNSGGAQSSQLLSKENVDKPIDPNEVDKPIDPNEVDKPIDLNEARYCVCNQIAFGTMVACDNKNCWYEWYHCECVGVIDPPKGKWYCPQCLTTMKRRRSRKPHKLN